MKGKTDPISIRFNTAHLAAAKEKSGIKKTQQLVDYILSEYIQEPKQIPAPLKKVKPDKEEVTKEKVISSQPPKEAAPVDKKWALGRIKELEDELKSPPKSPTIGLINWKRVRTDEIEKLKKLLQ